MEGGGAQGLEHPPAPWCHHGGEEEDFSEPVKLWWTPSPRGLSQCWKIMVATQKMDIFSLGCTYFCGQRFRHWWLCVELFWGDSKCTLLYKLYRTNSPKRLSEQKVFLLGGCLKCRSDWPTSSGSISTEGHLSSVSISITDKTMRDGETKTHEWWSWNLLHYKSTRERERERERDRERERLMRCNPHRSGVLLMTHT